MFGLDRQTSPLLTFHLCTCGLFIIRDTVKNSGFSKQISNLQHRAMSSRRRVNQSTSASRPRSQHSGKHGGEAKTKGGRWLRGKCCPAFRAFYPSSPWVVRIRSTEPTPEQHARCFQLQHTSQSQPPPCLKLYF